MTARAARKARSAASGWGSGVGRSPVAEKLIPQEVFHAAVFGHDRFGLRFKNLVEQTKGVGRSQALGNRG
jgi:hypothetical protein